MNLSEAMKDRDCINCKCHDKWTYSLSFNNTNIQLCKDCINKLQSLLENYQSPY